MFKSNCCPAVVILLITISFLLSFAPLIQSTTSDCTKSGVIVDLFGGQDDKMDDNSDEPSLIGEIGCNIDEGGTLTIQYYDLENAVLKSKTPHFASELFSSNEAHSSLDNDCFLNSSENNLMVPDSEDNNLDDNIHNNGSGGVVANSSYDDNYLYAIYEMEEALSESFLLKFELDGATFGKDVSFAPSNLDFVANPSGSHVSTTHSSTNITEFIPGGKRGDKHVTFFVQASQQPVDDKKLFLRLLLNTDANLSTPNSVVKLRAAIYTPRNELIMVSPTAILAKSIKSTDFEIKPHFGTQIDVTTGGIQFTGDTPTIANLGRLKIQSINEALGRNGREWQFGIDDPKPACATLTIEQGNFAASLTDSLTEPGHVFIDVNNNDSYDDDEDLIADRVESEQATFILSPEQLDTIYKANIDPPRILVEVDGITQINYLTKPPQATLKITYSNGNREIIKKKLQRITRNGTICTLYNIPSPTSIDLANIFFTNTSRGREGTLYGTLRNTEGIPIFTNQELVSNVPDCGRARLTVDDLNRIKKDAEWIALYGNVAWSGLAVLTVYSNLPSMEASVFIRQKTGGPLTNISLGSSGSGCD